MSLVLLAVCLPLHPAAAEDAHLAPETAAYLRQLSAGNQEAALDALGASGADPWLVVEDLIRIGKADAAKAIATATLTDDEEALAAYLSQSPAPSTALATGILKAEALLANDKAEEALAAIPDDRTTMPTVTGIRALLVRGSTLAKLDRHDDASDAYERAADRAAVIGWQRAEIDAQSAVLDAIAKQMGAATGDSRAVQRFTRRREHALQRLVSIDQGALDLAQSALWCAQLGTLEAKLQKWRVARIWLIEAESIFQALAGTGELTPELIGRRTEAIETLSRVDQELGALASSLAHALRAADLVKTQSVGLRVQVAMTLASSYWYLARFGDAAAHLERAIDLLDTEGDEALKAAMRPKLIGSHARTLFDLGDIAGARDAYQQVLASDLDRRTKYVVRMHIAAMALDVEPEERNTKDLQQALMLLLEVRRELEREPRDFTAGPALEANVLIMVGRALNLLGRFGEAEAGLRDALDHPVVIGSPGLKRYAQRELAGALRKKGKTREALKVATDALALLTEEIQRLPESLAMSRLAHPKTGELVDECVAAAVELGAPDEIRKVLEGTRSLVFQQEVRRRRRRGARGHAATGADVARRGREIAESLLAYSEAKAQGQSRRAVRKLRKELWGKRLALRALEERVRLEDTVADETPGRAPRRPAKRPALKRDEALLYLVSTGGRYMGILEWEKRLTMVELGSREDVHTRIAEARASWTLSQQRDTGPQKTAALIDRVCPAPLLEPFKAKEGKKRPAHVYIAAAGPLARLPWPVLLEEALVRSGTSRDDVPTVSIVASKAVLKHLRAWNPAARGGAILAIGDPDYTTGGPSKTRTAYFGSALTRLEGSGEEVKAIVREEAYDLALLGAEANEARLREALFDPEYPYDVLHLSCHGFLYQSAPWMSALALHATSEDDGLVTVDEVGRWEFRTGPRLVVLAACQSGLGEPVPGEGEEGLVRAFLLAGARHVVGSLWNVPDDTTRRLMIKFHAGLRDDGLSPVLALRAAQREIRASIKEPFKAMHAWAGWVVWGPRD